MVFSYGNSELDNFNLCVYYLSMMILGSSYDINFENGEKMLLK